MFTLLDVNEDTLLDTNDIDLFADHYVRENNLTEEEVKYECRTNIAASRKKGP